MRGVPIAALAVLVAACGPASTPTGPPRSVSTSSSRVVSTTRPTCRGVDLGTWSVTRLAAQSVVVPVEETNVAAAGPAVDQGAGGIILFGSAAPTDLGDQLATVEAGAPGGIAPLVMTDEEGGEVQRMANLVGSLPWPRTMAETMSVDAVRTLAAGVARAMRAAGVTMDLAPVLDLASGPGPDALHTDGPRSFSPVAQTATDYGLAFAQGLQQGGVIPVVKHFPGEGSASANTDDAPATTPPLSELETNDLLPFEAAVRAGLPAVMVGNATVPGLTTGPASLSAAAVHGLLETTLGFHGLVLTDSLSAAAVQDAGYSVPAAAVAAVAAGADMVLFNASASVPLTEETAQVVDAIADAVTGGTLPESRVVAAATAVLRTKGVTVCAT